jgi:hypothetical protein
MEVVVTTMLRQKQIMGYTSHLQLKRYCEIMQILLNDRREVNDVRRAC